MVSKKGKIIALLVFLVLLGFVGGFVYITHLALRAFDTSYDIDMSDPVKKREMETLTNLTFPPSVVWEYAHLDPWLDPFFFGKFRVSRKDLQTMFASIPFEWSDTKRGVVDYNLNKPWFRPDSIVKFRSGEACHPGKKSALRVLYDNSSDPDDENAEVLVYLFAVP